MSGISFVKGHGTQNDFVLVPDADGALAGRLDEAAVRRLADRYAGIGADGVIRVTRTETAAEVREQADDAEWFMDYRNADGSVAEMCGNGVRVMARYLWENSLADGPVLTLATRGGARTVHAEQDGQITVEMGRAKPAATRQLAFVCTAGRTWEAVPVRVPNPHAVVFVDDLDEAGSLTTQPDLRPAAAFPDSANIEFVADRGHKHIAMRVWERGVGETRSCGTGVCAAAWAAMRRDGAGAGSRYLVDVPGGRLVVTERPDGELLLTGPAVLGLRGTVVL
ncbi:diaminopimelate epimerase [Jiangella anatolica]|uniref:Diaminopimelate epimerase n=1 Tax=Jiangella anatolica TaxID=2670374 RepID=A0A2W2C0Q5_9ACTN|nr:diaminopimelate epimerase [Jiangella anatolica]PZF79356.1 diaminopimelate epimerase [Jiangella anatolica]